MIILDHAAALRAIAPPPPTPAQHLRARLRTLDELHLHYVSHPGGKNNVVKRWLIAPDRGPSTKCGTGDCLRVRIRSRPTTLNTPHSNHHA